MQGLVEFHCHLLPYVDDGAQTISEAKAMLAAQCAQGVRTVCVTPHWRSGMFETPWQEIERHYATLVAYAATLEPPLTLRLGREYYCDKAFYALLDAGEVRPIEGTRCVLIEFSPYRHTAQDLREGVTAVKQAGFIPLVAHVERYDAVRKSPQILVQLTQLGAYCQMNTEGLLGQFGLRERWRCLRLLKTQGDSISLIASDAHRKTVKAPNLGDCADYLRKKLSPDQWQALFVKIPAQLLEQRNEGWFTNVENRAGKQRVVL